MLKSAKKRKEKKDIWRRSTNSAARFWGILQFTVKTKSIIFLKIQITRRMMKIFYMVLTVKCQTHHRTYGTWNRKTSSFLSFFFRHCEYGRRYFLPYKRSSTYTVMQNLSNTSNFWYTRVSNVAYLRPLLSNKRVKFINKNSNWLENLDLEQKKKSILSEIA